MTTWILIIDLATTVLVPGYSLADCNAAANLVNLSYHTNKIHRAPAACIPAPTKAVQS